MLVSVSEYPKVSLSLLSSESGASDLKISQQSCKVQPYCTSLVFLSRQSLKVPPSLWEGEVFIINLLSICKARSQIIGIWWDNLL